MKKLFPLLLLGSSAMSSIAQSVTFSVPVAPCNNDGVITATFSGFTPPLTVVWNTQGTTGTTIAHTVTGMSDALTGYSGGPLTISVSDGTSSVSEDFAGMAPLTYTVTTTGAVCPNPGTVNVLAAGGTAPYTFQWYDKNTGSVVASGSTASMPTGNYGVMISDAAGCKYGSRVKNDTGLVTYTSFTATLTATPANCTDGTASVSAVSSSAVLPYSYHWSNGATTPSISGLSAGNYTVEIMDAMGCRATTDTDAAYNPYSIMVSQTTILSIPSTTTPATCTASDGAVSTSVSGGTPPYTYSWNNGATTASQTGIPAGAYYVTVTDANGCHEEASFLVGSTSPITVASSSSPSLCLSPTGNASLSPAGGTFPYSYVWYTTPMQTSNTATLLAPGNYAYRVTDAMGCIQTGTVTVPSVNEIDGAISSASPHCTMSDGNISVTPSGGAAPYTYLWSNGATSASVSGVTAGDYTVRITDNMGCKKTIPFTLESFSTVHAGLSTVDATCILNADGSIIATATGGTAPYTYGWSTGGSGATITGLRSGIYSVLVTDAAGCTASRTAYLGYDATNTDCFCTIEGTVYADTNSNCTQDAGEYGIPHARINCSGIGYTYTDANGHYSFMVPSGSYTVTETVLPYYPLSPCQMNGIPVTATASAGCTHSVDFANNVMPVHNVRISTSSLTMPVPGNIYRQHVSIINEGTLFEDSVMASYRTDGQLYTPAFTPSGIFAGAGITYNAPMMPVIAPGTAQSFVIDYNVPANMPVGTNVSWRDTVAAGTDMSAWVSDHTPHNNYGNPQVTVVSATTPNFKEVHPRGTGSNGVIYVTDTVLEYTVHFQNTGTWYAQDIEILDTLDADLDWTTIHPVFESAPCKVTVYNTGTVKVIRFRFDNINLPPQMFDDLRSTGMVTYTARILPGSPSGTQIRNTASIYFDHHAPIRTNGTLNTIGTTAPPPMAVNETSTNSENRMSVYPNPATQQFHTVLDAGKQGTALMTITDMTGKTISSRTLTVVKGAQTITTSLNGYTPGIYFVNVNTGDAVYTQKLVVIR